LNNGKTDAQIAELIQKLLALAVNNPNRAEAAAAYQKAQDLMHKYGLRIDVVKDGFQAAPPPPPPPRPQSTPPPQPPPQPQAAPPPAPPSFTYSVPFAVAAVSFLVIFSSGVFLSEAIHSGTGVFVGGLAAAGFTYWLTQLTREPQWLRPVVWGGAALFLVTAVCRNLPANHDPLSLARCGLGVTDAVLILACFIRPGRRFGWASLKKYVIGVSIVLAFYVAAGQDRPTAATAQQNSQPKPECATGYTRGTDDLCHADTATIVAAEPDPPIPHDVSAPPTEPGSTSTHSPTEDPAPTAPAAAPYQIVESRPLPAPSSSRSTEGCTVAYRKDADGTARPLLPVQLTNGIYSVNTVALVDSGADRVAFPLSYARRLGIDVSGLEPSETAGVGNAHILTYHAMVDLTPSFCGQEYQYPSLVAFVAGDSSLLGQAGFFDHFQVAFDRAKSELEIGPKTIPPAGVPPPPRGTGSVRSDPGPGTSLTETLNWLREKIQLALTNYTLAKDTEPEAMTTSEQGNVWKLDSCSAVIGETYTYSGPESQSWSRWQYTVPLGKVTRGAVRPWDTVTQQGYQFIRGQRQNYITVSFSIRNRMRSPALIRTPANPFPRWKPKIPQPSAFPTKPLPNGC
jgi:hypothetical protein